MASIDSNTSAPIHIVILGGGTAGWMTAAALVRKLPSARYRVTLVESDAIGTVGVGEATLPHIKTFNDMLGLDEAEFMRETQATFKLGIEFCDWDRSGDSYIHPFGAFGEPWGGVEFQHHWLRARMAGRTIAPFQDYSYAVAMARANAFELPDENLRSIRSTYSYAYHFDSGLYATMLRRWSIARGVKRFEGRVIQVERDGELLAALKLESSHIITGDLFIDCSGFRALLLGNEYAAEWEDWSQWLPCDRAWAVGCEHTSEMTPYTRATARNGGWQWRIPLQSRMGNGYIFSSAFIDPEDAREALLGHLDGKPIGTPRLLRFQPGRRVKPWQGNCVAIGLASGFLEPLESTSIYLIQASVVDLINLMPADRAGTGDPRLQAEFNRLNTMQYERVRDFLILHYIANRRVGEPLWDYLRTIALPDSLDHKLELFRSRGMIPDYQYGLFNCDSWLAVLLGQGLEPRSYDPQANSFDLDILEAKLADYKDRIDLSVGSMQSQTEFIANYCDALQAPSA